MKHDNFNTMTKIMYLHLFLKDPNTKRIKQTLIYFNTDTQNANFREIPFIKPQNDT